MTTAPSHTPASLRRALVLAALVALVGASLGGCLRATGDLTVHSDNTVSGTYVYAVSRTEAATLGVSAEDLASQLGAGDVITAFSHATTTPYDDGTLSGVQVDFNDEPITTFDGKTLADQISIVRDGGDFIVDAPTLGSVSGEDAATIEGATITLAVTFPGKVSDHNGTLVGRTVTWDLTTQKDAPHARGSARALMPLWVGIAASIALAACAVAAALWWRRRSRRNGSGPTISPE